MKTYKNGIYFLLVFLILFNFSSCSTKWNFLPSKTLPSAEGFVTVKKDKNQNYKIKVELFNAASPEKLNPPKSAYIVWMESKKSRIKNLGQIKITENRMTHGLKASFETVSPEKPRKILITAEDNVNAISPRSQVVLKTKKF